MRSFESNNDLLPSFQSNDHLLHSLNIAKHPPSRATKYIVSIDVRVASKNICMRVWLHFVLVLVIKILLHFRLGVVIYDTVIQD